MMTMFESAWSLNSLNQRSILSKLTAIQAIYFSKGNLLPSGFGTVRLGFTRLRVDYSTFTGYLHPVVGPTQSPKEIGMVDNCDRLGGETPAKFSYLGKGH